MGLFSSKKKIYVSSAIYNMAGDVEGRSNFLKDLVITNILSRDRQSLASQIPRAYLNGPGIKLRKFFRWVTKPGNYTAVGLPTGVFLGSLGVDNDALLPHLPHNTGEVVKVQVSDIGGPDFGWWADQWLLVNEPELIGTDYFVDFDDEAFEVIIFRADDSEIRFTPESYEQAGDYLYVNYLTSPDGEQTWDPARIFIYRLYSGNPELDALLRAGAYTQTQFFPHIPLRLDNKYISEYPNKEPLNNVIKAYKKLTGRKLNDLLLDIDANESIGDIDYAMLVFGLSANVRDKSCKRYIYRFLQLLLNEQFADQSDYRTWESGNQSFATALAAWHLWQEAQDDPDSPLYGTAEPAYPEYSHQPTNKMRVATTGALGSEFNMELSWSSMHEEVKRGLGKAGAKVGDVWWTELPPDYVNYKTYINKTTQSDIFDRTYNVVLFFFQETATTYREMRIVAMKHTNYVYKGKSVETDLVDALRDAEESEFLFPLHNPTLQAMSLVDKTQVSTACLQIVFNCYKVVKKKWYQTGIFKIFVFVAIIAISVATGGIGAASAGLLGTNAAVGSALGLTGLAGVVAGAVANALVAMIIMQAISIVSTTVFGAKLGMLVSIVATFVAMNAGSLFGDQGSLSINWSELSRADKLIQMTSAISSGVNQYAAGEIAKYAEKSAELEKEYNADMADLKALYEQNIGYGNATINPMMFTELANAIVVETSGGFFDRTLMTGGDIADISMNMIGNFADITLSNDLPI